MDDLLIPSTSVEQGLMLLDVVLDKVAVAGVKLKLDKCSFF